MNHAQLLDCTLRDGAYLVDKKFGDKTIKGIIKGLIKANIDLIEIGFLQNDGFGEGKTVFLNSLDTQKHIPPNKGNSKFTVLADYSRYSIENLDPYTGKSFDAVRACFFKNERKEAIDFFKGIKEKGYKVFIQPVDILGYSDVEIIDLINDINDIEPYCFSIVDTFGSMYADDLYRIYSLINHNLVSTCKIGFHSHDNLQMSSALSQEFLKMTYGNREVVIDATISGMGRGAGNTPTELVAQYMVSKLGYTYDIDAILDIIDGYMENIKARYSWGYSTPYFIAGSYSAHVNNISYLKQKNSIRSKDIRYILNKIGSNSRKRYDYDLLERTYMQYLESNIDDTEEMKKLGDKFEKRNIVIIAPGNKATTEIEKISSCIKKNNAIVITINFIHGVLKTDYLYFNNVKRYDYWMNSDNFYTLNKIITSNINGVDQKNETVVSFTKLIKCGWEHIDNSVIMLLRLLDDLNVNSIGLAGLDGYDCFVNNASNYATEELEVSTSIENPHILNKEIGEMIRDFINTKKSNAELYFITPSRFESFIKTDN